MGVLVFVADTLANAFVVSDPQDYRQLHRSIIEDVFCEVLWFHGVHYNKVPCFSFQLSEKNINSMEELENAFHKEQQRWHSFRADMAYELLQKPLFVQDVYKKNHFCIQRFFVAPHTHRRLSYCPLSNEYQ